MFLTILLLMFVPKIAVGVIAGPTKLLKSTCEEFSQDVTLNESQTLGTWYRLTPTDIPPHLQCMDFSFLKDKERFDLMVRMGKHIKEPLKWERLTLKIQLPCNETQTNHNRTYYMEKVGENDGSYKALSMPSTAHPDEYNLYPMRMKFIGQYLGLMDCYGQYEFFLVREKPVDGELNKTLKGVNGNYWSKDHFNKE